MADTGNAFIVSLFSLLGFNRRLSFVATFACHGLIYFLLHCWWLILSRASSCPSNTVSTGP